MTAGVERRIGLEPAVDFAHHSHLAVGQLDLGGEGALRPAEQAREHLARLIAIVVDRLLAHDDEIGAFRSRPGVSAPWRRRAARHSPRSSPGWRGRRPWRARCGAYPAALAEPIETATTSVASPRSLMRTASSTAISSKGFIDILTLARSTPLPSDFTPDLDVEVDNPLNRNQYFHAALFFPHVLRFPPVAPAARYLASAKWPGRYRRGPAKSMLRGFRRFSGPAAGAVEKRYAAPPHKQNEHSAGRQPTNMGPPCHALLAYRRQDRQIA